MKNVKMQTKPLTMPDTAFLDLFPPIMGGIKFTARYVGLIDSGEPIVNTGGEPLGNGRNHLVDQWVLQLGVHAIKYQTGIGHRFACNRNNPDVIRMSTPVYKGLTAQQYYDHNLLGQRVTQNDITDGTNSQYYHNCLIVRVARPTIADAIYCLLMDADSFSNADGVEYFADELGYTTDGGTFAETKKQMDKIESAYNSCAKQHKILTTLFSAEQIESLRGLLTDY